MFEHYVIIGWSLTLIGLAGMVGCAWEYLKDPISGKIQLTWLSLYRFATNPLYRTAAKRLVIAYLAIYAVIYVHSLRVGLDTIHKDIDTLRTEVKTREAGHEAPPAQTPQIQVLSGPTKIYKPALSCPITPNPGIKVTTHDFGEVQYGDENADKKNWVEIKNQGPDEVEIKHNVYETAPRAYKITGDFRMTRNGTCGVSILPGASCLVSVGFIPQGLRRRDGQLRFVLDDEEYCVELTGVGIQKFVSPYKP